jgi:hypothetical protein
MQRYGAGQLSRTQLMDELEKKLQMIQREGSKRGLTFVDSL